MLIVSTVRKRFCFDSLPKVNNFKNVFKIKENSFKVSENNFLDFFQNNLNTVLCFTKQMFLISIT